MQSCWQRAVVASAVALERKSGNGSDSGPVLRYSVQFHPRYSLFAESMPMGVGCAVTMGMIGLLRRGLYFGVKKDVI